jgi:hypothetical protein
MELMSVTTVNDIGLASVIRGVLEQAGITTVIGGGGAADTFPGGAVSPLQILVAPPDLDRARDVLAQYETMPEEDDDEP